MSSAVDVLNKTNNDVFPKLGGAFWSHLPDDLRYGWKAVYAHLLWRRLTGSSFIKAMNEFPYPMPARVTCAADLHPLSTTSFDQGYYRRQLDMLRRIVDRTKGRHPVFATVMNPFGNLRFTLGDARLAALIAEDSSAVCVALNSMADNLAVFARDCVEKAGATGIFFASQGGEASRLSAPLFETLVGAPDRFILAKAAQVAPNNILHICGRHIALQRYRDHLATAVSWDAAHNGPAAAFGPRACLMPGLDLRGALTQGDGDAIREEVRILHSNYPSDQVMLGAACSVSCDLPFWRMRTALACAQGGLPGIHPDRIDALAWRGLRRAARIRTRIWRVTGI